MNETAQPRAGSPGQGLQWLASLGQLLLQPPWRPSPCSTDWRSRPTPTMACTSCTPPDDSDASAVVHSTLPLQAGPPGRHRLWPALHRHPLQGTGSKGPGRGPQPQDQHRARGAGRGAGERGGPGSGRHARGAEQRSHSARPRRPAHWAASSEAPASRAPWLSCALLAPYELLHSTFSGPAVQYFASSSTDSQIKVWDLRTLGPKMAPALQGAHAASCQAAYFSPDGEPLPSHCAEQGPAGVQTLM